MGLIKIEFTGSFGEGTKQFGATTHGHAHAVNEAQAWLAEKMTEAINIDHQLRDNGARPNNGFMKERSK